MVLLFFYMDLFLESITALYITLEPVGKAVVEILTPKCMRTVGLGNERASLVILWDIVHVKILTTTKVNLHKLVRFRLGWLGLPQALVI